MTQTASDFADAVGRKRLADALQVGATAVSNAVVRGWFPSSWFLVAKQLAESAGVECQPQLFGMRMADNTQIVESAQSASAGGAK